MEKEKKENQQENPKVENWAKGAVVAAIVFLLFVFIWLSGIFGKKKLKSELATEYGVSTKVLMNWANLICPENIRRLYVGTKTKKVAPAGLSPYLGKPKDRPKDHKGRPIVNRKEICRTLKIENSTLGRRLREIENPDEVIGMSYEAFTKLRKFPPKQVNLILSYMRSKGYP